MSDHFLPILQLSFFFFFEILRAIFVTCLLALIWHPFKCRTAAILLGDTALRLVMNPSRHSHSLSHFEIFARITPSFSSEGYFPHTMATLFAICVCLAAFYLMDLLELPFLAVSSSTFIEHHKKVRRSILVL